MAMATTMVNRHPKVARTGEVKLQAATEKEMSATGVDLTGTAIMKLIKLNKF